jgi:hypothetical protein
MLRGRLRRIVADVGAEPGEGETMGGSGAGEAVVERMDASPLLLVGAMVMLAALDFLGAVLAKEWAEGRNHRLFAAGLVAFGALFAVYAVSLKVAELSTVTFGWIVTLQVGLLLLERIRYAVELPNGKRAAIVAILVLQAYLILAPNGSSP